MNYPPIDVKREAEEVDDYINDDNSVTASASRGNKGPAVARKKQKLKEPVDMGVMSENQICVVCGDYASGFHYSALTCEACKSFFKRTVQDKHEYTCSGNFDCSVSKSMRKSCQYCRFQKCLVNGMLPQDVRMDRTRGGRKKCKRTSREQFDQLVEQIAAPVGSDAAPAPAAGDSSAGYKPEPRNMAAADGSGSSEGSDTPPHPSRRRQLNGGNDDLIAADDGGIASDPLDSFIREAVANDAMIRPLTVGHWPGGPDSAAAFTAAIRDWFARGLHSIVSWSNSLKCLDALLLQDRIALLSKNWFAILLMDTLARCSPFTGVVHFANNFSVGPDEAAACQVPQDFYATLSGMLQSFDQLGPCRSEISILKLLALLDHSVVDDIGIISRTEALRGATLRALYRVSSVKLNIDEQSEQCDLYVSKLLLRQGFTVNLKMGLDSWRSLDPPSQERCTESITRCLGIQAASPTARSSPEEDCTSTDSCPDQFRSRVYFKTLRSGSGPVTPQALLPPPPPPPPQHQQQQLPPPPLPPQFHNPQPHFLNHQNYQPHLQHQQQQRQQHCGIFKGQPVGMLMEPPPPPTDYAGDDDAFGEY